MSKPAQKPSKAESVASEPVVTSFSIVKRKEGFSFVTTKTQGDRVIDQAWTDPDMKSAAIERFKIEVAKQLIMGNPP